MGRGSAVRQLQDGGGRRPAELATASSSIMTFTFACENSGYRR